MAELMLPSGHVVLSTQARHPLSPVEASTICQDLHSQGIDVVVRMVDQTAHIYPTGPVEVREEVTALAAFIAASDTRLYWHATRSTP